MSLTLYVHPFSSYSWKALIPFYENDTPFILRSLEEPAANAELRAVWPRGSFPALMDEGRVVLESTAIIEHLAVHHPGPVRLIPDDPAAAVEARMLDRIFDNHVQGAFQSVVGDALRPPERRDPTGVEETKAKLELIYAWLDGWMDGREWASGNSFSLADCAAAPALFYGDWTHPIDANFAHLHAYRRRLLARPSVSRCVEAARPMRHYFPLGAPDRD